VIYALPKEIIAHTSIVDTAGDADCEQTGSQFDPQVVAAFLQALQQQESPVSFVPASASF
jgi:hypothetical protein